MQPKPADDLDIVDELFDDGEEEQASSAQTQDDAGGAALLEEIKRLRDEITASAEAAQAQQTQQAEQSDDEEPPVQIDVPQLDDKQLGKLAQYKDKLEAIAKHATGPELQQVAELVKDVKAQLKELQTGMQEQAKVTFAQQLRVAIPDLDALHQDDKFKEYLKQPAPLSGGKAIGTLLAEAYEQQDLVRVQEIIGNFRKDNQKSASPAMRPPVSSMSTTHQPAPRQSDSDALDEKYLKTSTTLLKMYLEGDLDDAEYQEKVRKLQRKYDMKVNGGEEAVFV